MERAKRICGVYRSRQRKRKILEGKVYSRSAGKPKERWTDAVNRGAGKC
jgi:hypothetical protein